MYKMNRERQEQTIIWQQTLRSFGLLQCLKNTDKNIK
jgi:hypothetical protein